MATEVCGFITIVGGTFLLHATRDLDLTPLDLDHLTKGDRAGGGGDGGGGGGTPGGARAGSGSSAVLRGRRPLQQMELTGAGGAGKHLALDVGGNGGEGGGAAAAGEREDDPLLNSSRKR